MGGNSAEENEAHAEGRENQDLVGACRQVSLALELAAEHKPLSTTTLAGHQDASRPDTAAKRVQRSAEALGECGLHVTKLSGAPDPSLWEADDASWAPGRLDARSQVLARMLVLPMAHDPLFPYRSELVMAVGKISTSPKASRLVPMGSVGRIASEAEGPAYQAVRGALAQGVCLAFSYRDRHGADSERVVSPLHLFDARGHVYLEACGVDEAGRPAAVRVYRLDRMSDARVLGERPRVVPDGYRATYPRLPFQLGPLETTCEFVVPDGARAALPRLCEERGRLVDERGQTRWEVRAASMRETAAFGIAYGLVPVGPDSLVEAWEDLLAGASRLEATSLDGLLAKRDKRTRRRGSRAGRKGTLRFTRLLLAIAASLGHPGDRLCADDVARRFGVDLKGAYDLLEAIVGIEYGDGSRLPVAPPLDDEDPDRWGSLEFVGDEGANPIRPLRLTASEWRALDEAFSWVEGPLTEALSREILAAFGPAGPSQPGTRPRRSPAAGVDTRLYASLVDAYVRSPKDELGACRGTCLTFLYQGEKDDEPRLRHVEPALPRYEDGVWMIDAYDLDRREERCFLLGRMSQVGSPEAVTRDDPPTEAPRASRRVSLLFSDRHILDLLEWRDLAVDADDGERVLAHISYGGGPWLQRHLAACGDTVATDDEGLARDVRAWSSSQLALGPRA